MAVWPVSAQISLKFSAEDGAGATVGRDIVNIVNIIQDISDLSQAVWSSLTRRAGQVGNVTDVSGAALSLGVHERRASGVGAAAATTTAAAAAAVVTAIVTAATTTTVTAAAAASSGNSNGERGHEGDEKSGQLHVDGGKKTRRLNSNGVSVWLKTEDC